MRKCQTHPDISPVKCRVKRLTKTFSLRPESLIRRRNLPGGRVTIGTPVSGNGNPGNEIDNEADARAESDSEPQDAHESHVHIHITCKPGADAADLLVAFIQHQPARIFGRRREGRAVAAFGAIAIVVTELNTTFCAVHWRSPLVITRLRTRMFKFGGRSI